MVARAGGRGTPTQGSESTASNSEMTTFWGRMRLFYKQHILSGGAAEQGDTAAPITVFSRRTPADLCRAEGLEEQDLPVCFLNSIPDALRAGEESEKRLTPLDTPRPPRHILHVPAVSRAACHL